MIGLALIAAAVAAAPAQRSIDPANWITMDDYPGPTMFKKQEGVVGIVLTVGVDGIPQTCRVAETSKVPVLDRETCRLVLLRAQFPTTPAPTEIHRNFAWKIQNRIAR